LSWIERLVQAGFCRTLPISALREKAVKAETVVSVAHKSAASASDFFRSFALVLPAVL